MAWLEEWEEQLGGRIKSVLILALAAFLLMEYNNGNIAYRMVEPVASVKVTSECENQNPIDSYFQKLEGSVPQECMARFDLIYLECWEMELAHAYHILSQELPASFFEAGGYGTKGQESFSEFTLAQSYLENYYGSYVEKQEDLVRPGDAVKTRLELTKAQTLRLYQLIHKEQNLKLAELFVFEEEDAKRLLENSGVWNR